MEHSDKYKKYNIHSMFNEDQNIKTLKWMLEMQKYNLNNLIGIRDILNNLIKFTADTAQIYKNTSSSVMQNTSGKKEYPDQINKDLLNQINNSFQDYVRSNNEDIMKLFKNGMECFNDEKFK